MTVLQFETTIDEPGIIRLPEDIAAQLAAEIARGLPLHVSIKAAAKATAAPTAEPVVEPSAEPAAEAEPEPELTPDEAWAAVVRHIEARIAAGPVPGSYKWRREDAYEHLDRYGPDRAD